MWLKGRSSPKKGKTYEELFGVEEARQLRQHLSDVHIGQIPSSETIEKRRNKLTGRKLSENTRKKISNSHKGKKFTKEHRRKLRLAKLGRPSYNRGIKSSDATRIKISKIRGGDGDIERLNNNYRRNKKDIEWSRKIFERDNYICQMCRNKGGKLHTHHIEKKSKYPKKRYKLSNGITLCADCHHKIQGREENWAWLFKIKVQNQQIT